MRQWLSTDWGLLPPKYEAVAWGEEGGMTDCSISLPALDLNLLQQWLPAVPAAVCWGPTIQTCQPCTDPPVMHTYSQNGVPSLNLEKQVSRDTLT